MRQRDPLLQRKAREMKCNPEVAEIQPPSHTNSPSSNGGCHGLPAQLRDQHSSHLHSMTDSHLEQPWATCPRCKKSFAQRWSPNVNSPHSKCMMHWTRQISCGHWRLYQGLAKVPRTSLPSTECCLKLEHMVLNVRCQPCAWVDCFRMTSSRSFWESTPHKSPGSTFRCGHHQHQRSALMVTQVATSHRRMRPSSQFTSLTTVWGGLCSMASHWMTWARRQCCTMAICLA
mmetsp:Transcript_42871/g.77893  ORF Transcript_42871/g.77893 Transcript_42871/m.77893 type:complete len:230 (-) Transcript_42871:573-1262(-)